MPPLRISGSLLLPGKWPEIGQREFTDMGMAYLEGNRLKRAYEIQTLLEMRYGLVGLY